ncbi:4-coumarate--CoA ligase-like 3 [Vitis vinifera]|uniref:4-coumarate--CoA ligase-like 3 n=1 Tax=Vitis vinifera TaxID=29760 RepID=A0A438BT55_VITVI|nr:4-coumarate--CoA ligase-like 3 [Vitis vinifera]
MGISDFAVDPRSGFCAETRTFHSLRPTVQLPPENVLLSADAYTYSLRAPSPGDDSPVIINSTTGQRLSYSEFVRRSKTLAAYLQSIVGLNKGDAAYILSTNLIQVPVLYFALLSLGPVIAFTISTAVHKIPKLRYGTIVIDSFEFELMMTSPRREMVDVKVSQSDLAGIMYSSGTTGNVKGVMVTHRNLIAMTGSYMQRKANSPVVLLQIVPCSGEVQGDELGCGSTSGGGHVEKGCNGGPRFEFFGNRGVRGAPLGKELIEAFTAKFPGRVISQHWIGKNVPAGAHQESFLEFGKPKLLIRKQALHCLHSSGGALGYVNDPKATSETLTPEWVAEDRLLLPELEHLLQSHPQIVDAAVIPYPDDEAGQVPMAFIVRRPESKLDEAQVMDFIAKQVAPYKKIRRVSFVTSIPKNASGKILRKELKKISLPESFPKL